MKFCRNRVYQEQYVEGRDGRGLINKRSLKRYVFRPFFVVFEAIFLGQFPLAPFRSFTPHLTFIHP